MFKNIFCYYKTLDNKVFIDAQIDGKMVWLTQDWTMEFFVNQRKLSVSIL